MRRRLLRGGPADPAGTRRSNRAMNLWPEPYDIEWNAHVKDRLEGRLHRMVCARELDLPPRRKPLPITGSTPTSSMDRGRHGAGLVELPRSPTMLTNQKLTHVIQNRVVQKVRQDDITSMWGYRRIHHANQAGGSGVFGHGPESCREAGCWRRFRTAAFPPVLVPAEVRGDRETRIRCHAGRAKLAVSGFSEPPLLTGRRPSCAVSMSRNSGVSGVLGFRPDRFDHQVSFVGAVDLARYAVSRTGLDELGC